MTAVANVGAVVEFFPRHDDVDWNAVIDKSKTIDIVVHYYGRWVRNHSDAFGRFFGRGGRLRLIVADPEMPETLGTVHRHFFPEISEAGLKERILETKQILQDIFNETHTPQASFSTHYFPRALHYACLLSNGRDLYLSAYEQFRGRVIRSSIFHLDLHKDTGVEDHWNQNVSDFLRQSRQ